MLRDRGFDSIAIADGPSINRPVEEVFVNSGMRALAARLGVELIDLNQATRRPIAWAYGEIGMPEVILDADYYVNVPKMKTHVRCGVTLSLKNQQGICDYDEKRNNHKRGVDEPLGALGKVLKPDLGGARRRRGMKETARRTVRRISQESSRPAITEWSSTKLLPR